jgi:coenzyme F420-0:L-glutamate ligase/coenzyme F420-1:gamma-L-glutamate ligase
MWAAVRDLLPYPHNLKYMDISQLIKSRRAVRRYQDRLVPKELVLELLELAGWAPSAHNRQPWRLAVLTQPADKSRLAGAMGERLRRERTADGDPPDDIVRDVARSRARITGAPVVLVVCLSMADMDTYPDERRSRYEWVMAVQSVSMAAQTLWLAAHSRGLAACWLCAPLFAPDEVRQTLNLPTNWEPLGLMTLGYPAEKRARSRKQLDDWVIWL